MIQPDTFRCAHKSAIKRNGMKGWEELYQLKMTPWDLDMVTPAIQQFLSKAQLPNDVQTVLIPGCGGGFDVIEFSKYTSLTIGLDISKSAITMVHKNIELCHAPWDHIRLIEGDFYTYQPSETIDLIYDYTFLCAMDPSIRSQWASKMKSLIRSHGYLLCLMFPLSDHDGGPPFSLSVDIYRSLLQDSFECLWIHDCESVASRSGLEKLSLWKKIS